MKAQEHDLTWSSLRHGNQSFALSGPAASDDACLPLPLTTLARDAEWRSYRGRCSFQSVLRGSKVCCRTIARAQAQ